LPGLSLAGFHDSFLSVYASINRWFDRFALRTAATSVKPYPLSSKEAEEARSILRQPGALFENDVTTPTDVTFSGTTGFRFTSPHASPWPENNIVFGRLFRASKSWPDRPTVLLLHGWNAELGYRWLFPQIARRLNRHQLNAAMIELPFHGQRKPMPSRLNFLSGDLVRMLQATRQSVADVRALAHWLAKNTRGPVGLCGFSLGAWLAGLVICQDSQIEVAVLATPVAKLDRAIAELGFCKPIRLSCESFDVWPHELSLINYTPVIPNENVLFVQARDDLFAPADTVEEIALAWPGSEIWRVPYGHITVLGSPVITERIVRWAARRMTRPLSAC
jgi:pimeloyl-ACP methyl ester carboxylesterase